MLSTSTVNAGTLAGHSCDCSVDQRNAIVIRLKCDESHHPAGIPGGLKRSLSVDQIRARTYQAPGHIAQCLVSQIALSSQLPGLESLRFLSMGLI